MKCLLLMLINNSFNKISFSAGLRQTKLTNKEIKNFLPNVSEAQHLITDSLYYQ